jgi:hypothetical protein
MKNTILAAVTALVVGFTMGYVIAQSGVVSPHAAMMKEDMKGMPEGAMGDMMAHNHAMIEIAADNAPTVTLRATPDTKSGYNLNIETTNYTFTPENAGGSAVANTGHAHLYVNDEKVSRVYGNWVHLDAKHLKPGANKIEVTLNADDHSEWAVNGAHIGAVLMLEGK